MPRCIAQDLSAVVVARQKTLCSVGGSNTDDVCPFIDIFFCSWTVNVNFSVPADISSVVLNLVLKKLL